MKKAAAVPFIIMIILLFSDVCTAGVREIIKSGEQWGGIYIGGKKAGYCMTRLEDAPGGYKITDWMRMSLKKMGTGQMVYSVTTEYTDASFNLKSFEMRLSGGGSELLERGVVEGAVLKLEIVSGGVTRKTDVDVGLSPHADSDMDFFFLLNNPEPGSKGKVRYFDTNRARMDDMELAVEAVEQSEYMGMPTGAIRIRQTCSGISATHWFSPDHGSLRVEMPMGMTIVSESREMAEAEVSAKDAPGDFALNNSIPVGVKISEPRKVESLSIRLSGVSADGLSLDGDGQQFAMGVVTVKAVRQSFIKPCIMPVTDDSVSDWLKPEPFIQSDDPGIIAKAAEITGGEKDLRKAARMICDWVYRSMAKSYQTATPSAVEILKNPRGDCRDHTALYVALARSAGIPAREAFGIVLYDGRFYYHAWPEVYLGEWVAADPTFGIFPADAARVRFVYGDDKRLALLNLFGKLKVEVLDWR